MARLLYHDFYQSTRKCRIVFLAWVWLIGMLLGIGSLEYTGEGFLLLIRAAISGLVPLSRLLLISYLPCVLSVFVIWIGVPQLLIAICFFKSWLLGLIYAGCITAFGSAGWLIGFLTFFREGISMILLWLLWISYFGRRQPIRWVQFSICFAAITGITYLDYRFISPFLVTLIEL